MPTKNYQINQLQSDDTLLTLHPETNASVVGYTDNKGLGKTNVQDALDAVAVLASNSGVTGIKFPNNNVEQGEVTVNYTKVGAEPSGAVSTHNSSSASHSDIRSSVSTAQSRADSAYSLAEGRSRAVSYDTVAAMTTALKSASNTAFKVGDNIYIKATNVPDYWISNVLSTNTGTYGYYEVSILETDKVNLEPYQLKEDNSINVHVPSNSVYDGKKTVVNALNVINEHVYGLNNAMEGILATGTEVVKRAEYADTAGAAASATTATTATSATTATKLASAKSITIGGDASGSANFDGSAPVTISVSLANSGVTAGTYSTVSVDAKGRVTAGAQMIEVGTSGQTTPSSSLAIGGLFFKLI